MTSNFLEVLLAYTVAALTACFLLCPLCCVGTNVCVVVEGSELRTGAAKNKHFFFSFLLENISAQ